MGVEFRRLLIPRPNTFRPGAAEALALIEALQRENWLPREFVARVLGEAQPVRAPLDDLPRLIDENDFKLAWAVESLERSGLRYPLSPLPFDDPADSADCYYDIELHFARDFIYYCSEFVDPFEPAPACACGQGLEREPDSDEDPFYSSRLAFTCPACGETFDPTNLSATGRDGWTGDPVKRKGGAAHRFALVIDCGKYFGGRTMQFDVDLKALVEKTLGVSTYEVDDYY